MKTYTMIKTLLCIAAITFFPGMICGQNNSSPYSILGIGDVDFKDLGRYSASGNAALARRDMYAYNFSNPASLTALPLKTMHFDLFMRGRVSNFSLPDEATVTEGKGDFIVRRISMAFKLTEKTAIAFGLRPYSSVNYTLEQEQAILDGNSSYYKLIEGNGGINQFYFSGGWELGKRISVGVTTSYMFGSLQRNTQYLNSFVNITKEENDFYYGGLFQAGFQYYTPRARAWQHKLGITTSAGTNLNGEFKTGYVENGTTVSKTIDEANSFKLPLSVSVGYAATSRQGLTLSVEGRYDRWKYQKVNYSNSYTYPAVKVSMGMEYSIGPKNKNAIERGYIGLGINAENSYLRIERKKLWDYSVSFGGGVNASRNLGLYGSLEIGRKGNTSSGQIKENYTQFMVGLILKDIWIGWKRFGRYD